MNEITVSTASGHTTTQKIYKIERIEEVINDDDDMDDDDEPPSSPGSMYDEDMEMGNLNDDVVQQLAAAGPVGVAAAAAIASSKKRRRHHSFETNPSIRKRQQNRLLRKLRQIIYEFTGRVGQQAIVLVATPGKPNTSFKVFGAKPLEDVVRNLKSVVMEELETALANQAPPPQQEDPTLFELPPLIIDGIPTPVEKMTQAQLRAFIPLMLKYSTGRGKPGWGRESTRPPWWPKELPWANVRMDARTEEDKQKISWTHALRKIVVNCYKYHGREDLLPTFSDDEEKNSIMITNSVGSPGSHNGQAQIHIQTTSQSTSSSQTSVVTTTAAAVEAARQQANNSNVGSVLKLHNSGTIITQSNLNQSNIIQTSNGTTKIELHTSNGTTTIQPQSQHHSNQQNQSIQTSNSTAAQTIANAQVCLDPMTLSDVDYTQAVISTIQNADGTVSLFQMDPNNPIITLPDGTTAQVQGVATLHQGEGGATIQTVQSLTDANGHENMTVDLTEATLGQDGQIIITGEDGQGYPVSVGNMITLPVSSSIYQTMMANIQHIQPNGDGTVCIAPMQVDSNDVHSSNNLSSVNSSNDSSNCNSNLNYIQTSSSSPSQPHHHQNHHQQQQQQQSQHHNKQTTHMLPNAKLVRAIFQDNLPNRNNLNHNNHSNNNNSNNSSDLASQSLLNHSNNNNNNNNNNNSSSNNHNTSNNNSSQSQHEMFGNPTTTTTYIQIQHPQHQTSSSSPNSNSSSSCSSTICCSSSAVTPTTYTTVPPLTTVINRTNNICQKQVLLTTKRRKQGFNELILHQHDSSSSAPDQKLKKRSKMMEVEQDDDVDDEAEEGGVNESDVGVDVGELEEVGEVTIKVELQSQLSLSPTEVKLEDEDQIGSN